MGIEQYFIWDKPRTIVQKPAFLIILRNFSGEAELSAQLYIFVRTKNIKQDLETTKMSINRGVGKEDVIYIYKVYVHTQWNITQP